MAGSVQNIHPGEDLAAVRAAALSGTVKKAIGRRAEDFRRPEGRLGA